MKPTQLQLFGYVPDSGVKRCEKCLHAEADGIPCTRMRWDNWRTKHKGGSTRGGESDIFPDIQFSLVQDTLFFIHV